MNCITEGRHGWDGSSQEVEGSGELYNTEIPSCRLTMESKHRGLGSSQRAKPGDGTADALTKCSHDRTTHGSYSEFW